MTQGVKLSFEIKLGATGMYDINTMEEEAASFRVVRWGLIRIFGDISRPVKPIYATDHWDDISSTWMSLEGVNLRQIILIWTHFLFCLQVQISRQETNCKIVSANVWHFTPIVEFHARQVSNYMLLRIEIFMTFPIQSVLIHPQLSQCWRFWKYVEGHIDKISHIAAQLQTSDAAVLSADSALNTYAETGSGAYRQLSRCLNIYLVVKNKKAPHFNECRKSKQSLERTVTN